MPTKRALIVDDSKTAQFKLIRILEQYDLIIDTALSAEDALSYLSYQVPDVIFMDHSMKGMSGLDAVKIIKSNEQTATIPVVMYTAQSGEVYLSQARAIGAIEVLSKDVMTPSDIERVMSSLKLLPRSGKQTAIDGENAKNTVVEQETRVVASTDLVQIRDQVAKSLDIQQGQMRRELQDNTRLLVTRFMREIRGLREDMDKQKKLDRDLLSMNLQSQEPQFWASSKVFWVAVSAISIMGLAWAGWNLNTFSERNQLLVSQNKALAANLEAQKEQSTRSRTQAVKAAKYSEEVKAEKLLQAFVWAINQKGKFGFNEPALGDERLPIIAGLLDQLSAIDFRGTLTLDIHNGDFCVVRSDDGNLNLPASPMTLSACDFVSNSAYQFDQGSQTSVAFINLLETFPLVESGKLNVEIKSHGVSKPEVRYPEFASTTTSDQWNAVASDNNRVSISLQN